MSKKPDSGLTIISISTQLQGDLIVRENLRVEGKIKGKVEVSGDLVITETGLIEGQVTASEAFVAGKIFGNLSVKGKTIFESHSFLQGDLKTQTLVIHDGAKLHGQCDMEKNLE